MAGERGLETEKRGRCLTLPLTELVKIKSYRAPRDKIICVLNCSKVIFGRLFRLSPLAGPRLCSRLQAS